ncbi:insulin-like growth factor binding protein [Anaeramoeba flamelloides]|uniref:Insulin-like growth factor binding protein n=1 Tax=Anaeramoeba flamelloides TaxID=1746091 RepID=A0ABQ8YUE5_9EUKA|nr:insulin-like growth factor binding protein [Anaeramoeba flamelloides]
MTLIKGQLNAMKPIGLKEGSKTNIISQNVHLKHLPNYDSIQYVNIYENVDLEFIITKEQQVKSSFILKKAKDLDKIKWKFESNLKLSINDYGELIFKDSDNHIVISESEPIFFQFNNQFVGEYKILKSHYSEEKAIYQNIVSFDLNLDKNLKNAYINPNNPLIIDPDYNWFSTYLNGSDANIAYASISDKYGNVYLTGTTLSNNKGYDKFILTENVLQNEFSTIPSTFVLKMVRGSTIQWSTLFDGENTTPSGIVIDSEYRPIIMGLTKEIDGNFKTQIPLNTSCDSEPNIEESPFVTKFSFDGSSLEFSTLICPINNMEITLRSITYDFNNDFLFIVGENKDIFPDFPNLEQKCENVNTHQSFLLKMPASGTEINGVVCPNDDLIFIKILYNENFLYIVGSKKVAVDERGSYVGYIARYDHDLNKDGDNTISGDTVNSASQLYLFSIDIISLSQIYAIGFSKNTDYVTSDQSLQKNCTGTVTTCNIIFRINKKNLNVEYSAFVGVLTDGGFFEDYLTQGLIIKVASNNYIIFSSWNLDLESNYKSVNYSDNILPTDTDLLSIIVYDVQESQIHFKFDLLAKKITEIFLYQESPGNITVIVNPKQGFYISPNAICPTRQVDPDEETIGIFSIFYECEKGYYIEKDGCKKCGIGTYSDETTQTDCKKCEEGTYSDEYGLSTCKLCPASMINNEVGLDHCLGCESGTYQQYPGKTFCSPCAVGTYANGTGNALCSECQPGTYTDEEGSFECSPCPAGEFSNEFGAVTCSVCGGGTYQDNEGQASCKQCPPGTYGIEEGMQKCNQCQAGYYSHLSGQSECSPCDQGYFASESGSDICSKCPYDTYQSQTGSVECISCPENSVTFFKGRTAITACVCDIGFIGNSESGCTICPPGGVCDVEDLQYPKANYGYWHSSEEPNEFIKCTIPEACPGGDVENCNSDLGYTGNTCAECLDEYYKFEGSCQSCPQNDGARFFLIFLVLFVFMMLMFVLAKKARAYFGSFTIAFFFLQILGIMHDMGVEWPSNLQTTFKIGFAFNFSVDFLAMECQFQLTYWQKWYLIMLSPFVFFVMMIVIYIVVWNHSQFVQRVGTKFINCLPSLFTEPSKKETNKILYPFLRVLYPFTKILTNGFSQEERKSFINNFINAYTVLLSLIYLSLCYSILEVFDCTKQSNGVYTLNSEQHITCYDSSYYKHLASIIIFGLVYIIGTPIFLGWLMFHYSKKLTDKLFDEKFGLLCSRYKKEYFYWELVIMIRKLFIVVFQIYLKEFTNLQLILCIIVLLASLIAQTILNPYLAKRHNHLEFALLSISIILLFGGTIFNTGQFSYSSSERDTLSMVMVLLIIFSILLMLTIILFEVRHRFRVVSGKDSDETIVNKSIYSGKRIIELLQKKEISFSRLLLWLGFIDKTQRKHALKFYIRLSEIMDFLNVSNENFVGNLNGKKDHTKLIWKEHLAPLFTKWYQTQSSISHKVYFDLLMQDFFQKTIQSHMNQSKKNSMFNNKN